MKTNSFQVPEIYQDAVLSFLLGFRNDTTDFQKAHLRSSTSRFCNSILFCYCGLMAAGCVSNLGLLYCLAKQPIPRTIFTWHFVNLALSDIFKSVIVLPFTAINILFHNWRLGEMACYIFPMIQEIPLHVSGWTFYFIPNHHLKFLQDPGRALQVLRPKILLTWLISLFMVLPYGYYTLYIDLGMILNHQFQGTGICGMPARDGIYEYFRGLFIMLCLLPLILSFHNFKKVEKQLNFLQLPRVVVPYVAGAPSSTKMSRGSKVLEKSENQSKLELNRIFLDVRKEKISHKYFVRMYRTYSLSLVPLICFRIYILFIQNSSENDWIVFAATTWIAFVSTCTTSFLYASWQLSL